MAAIQLDRWRRSGGVDKADTIARRLRADLNTHLTDWRGWTWRRAQLQKSQPAVVAFR